MKLEQSIKVYEDDMKMDVLSFHQIRDWYKLSALRTALHLHDLINLLRKRLSSFGNTPSAKSGSNETPHLLVLGYAQVASLA